MEQDKNTRQQEFQLIIFNLAGQEYGLPITQVQEIIRISPVTHLPQVPDFMEGVINLRGKVIPVIDLRKRFQLSVAEYTDDSRVIIVEVAESKVGIIVDAVMEVVRMATDSVEPPPAAFILDARYIQGLGKISDRLVIILDLSAILTSREKIALQDIQAEMSSKI